MSDKQIVFENSHIRRHYNLENEVWYFSLVDIVAVLTDSANPTDYLKKMRKRDSELHSLPRDKLSPGTNDNQWKKT
jgi:hypothetical protein